MTGTTHALVGAAVGSLCRRPGRAVAVAVGTHLVLDWLPHRDPRGRLGLLLDATGVAALLALLGVSRRWAMLAGALGAIAPDLEHLARLGTPPAMAWFPSHRRDHGAASTAQGIGTEVLVAASALLVLTGLKPRVPAPTGGGS